MGENGLEMLTELFNKIWEEGRIPKDWKMGTAMPLFKKRGIEEIIEGSTLLSVVLKVYERIVEKKVGEILDKQLEESQSGFRKGRSCQDHMFTLKQISEKIRERDQKMYVGFVDVLKAFDSVPWQS